MTKNIVCLKCLEPIHSSNVFKKSEFEYFHSECYNKLEDVTNEIPSYDEISDNSFIKLKTYYPKGTFIDLSDTDKILAEYHKNKDQIDNIEKIIDEEDNINNFIDQEDNDENLINEKHKKSFAKYLKFKELVNDLSDVTENIGVEDFQEKMDAFDQTQYLNSLNELFKNVGDKYFKINKVSTN